MIDPFKVNSLSKNIEPYICDLLWQPNLKQRTLKIKTKATLLI